MDHQRLPSRTAFARVSMAWKGETSSDLGPLENVIFGWSYGEIGRSDVALVEHAYLVRPKGTDDAMQESSVMEDDEIFILPFVGVHKL